jgi:ABC-type multidrug transport system ATPase subunit
VNAVAAASVEIHEVPQTREPVVVSAQGLTRRYGAGDAAVDALRGVSLDVAEGELVAVMGPSGSG